MNTGVRRSSAVWAVALGVTVGVMVHGIVDVALAKESLVIAASPSLKAPLEALGSAFEAVRPEVRVRLFFDSGLGLRQTIAGLENTGKHFIGTGPFHLVAPGGDELLDRLEHKQYVLPGTRRAYLAVPLVLVVPASLVDGPTSFDALSGDARWRVAIADPHVTELGRQTDDLLNALAVKPALKGRLDVAHDARGVLDHVLRGEADVGILFGPIASRERDRVRITAVAPDRGYRPVVHSMAMERYCPNRPLCTDFLDFLQAPEAQAIIKRLGYVSPVVRKGDPRSR